MQTTATTITEEFATTVTAEAFAPTFPREFATIITAEEFSTAFPPEFATIVTAEEFATTYTEEIGPLQKPELCEPADWTEKASAERLRRLLPLLRKDLCTRGTCRRARHRDRPQGQVRAMPNSGGPSHRPGHRPSLLQSVHTTVGHMHLHLRLLPVTQCHGRAVGVHLEA